jgi:hypothetical protein
MKPSPAYPFEKGDLLYQHPADHTLRPASSLNAEGAAATDQQSFAEYFAGIANEKYGLQTGELSFRLDQVLPKSVVVCTSGRFEFDCPSQIFAPLQSVGIYSNGHGCPSPQKVDALQGGAALSQAIGVAMPGTAAIEDGVARDRVIVDIQVRKPLGTAASAGSYTGSSGQ